MKTAVEWLVEELKGVYESDYFNKLIEQAKEMEKEQIIDAWDNAYDKGTRDRLEKVVNPVGDADTYFKETFNPEL